MKNTTMAFFAGMAVALGAAHGAPIYEEDFTGEAGNGLAEGGTNTPSSDPNPWVIDTSLGTFAPTGDFFLVTTDGDGRGGIISGESFHAKDVDGEVLWTSPSIDVSLFTDLVLSVDIAGSDGLDTTNGSPHFNDYVDVRYILDTGSPVALTDGQPYARIQNGSLRTLGDHTTNWGEEPGTDPYETVTGNIPNGSTVKIQIALRNNVSSELIFFDNMTLTGNAIPAPSPEDIVIESFSRSPDTGLLTLNFETQAGATYSVFGGETLSNLASWSEISISDLNGTGGSVSFPFTPVGTPSKYFLQVRQD